MKEPSCCASADDNPKGAPGAKKSKPDWLFLSGLLLVTILYLVAWKGDQYIPVWPWLDAMARTSFQMVNQVWWGVLVGIVFIGILSKVPREFIVALLGKKGTFKGILRATGAGVLLDLCSHGILMVGVRLYERGASIGQVIAFLVASPWNSFSLTLILISLIGWKLTLLFIVLSMVIALVTGYIFDLLVKKGILPDNPNQIEMSDEPFHFMQEAKTRLKKTDFTLGMFGEMMLAGFKDSRVVLRWLFVGILLAGVLQVIFDPSQFSTFFGPTLLGLGFTLIVATIIEVCSEGSAPIASNIINQAGAAGNGFVFLMAGASTDYTEIIILRSMTGSLKTALFLPLITVPQVVFIAWLINIYTT